MKLTPPSEHQIQVLVIEYISSASKNGCFAIACANAGKRSMYTGRRMVAEGLTAGVADLCVLLPGGRVGWLELKTAKGRQSIAQKGFAARCRRLDHPYAVAHDFDEAVEILKSWGAVK
jgi:hypothetical protein